MQQQIYFATLKMDQRYFDNPYEDYKGEEIHIDKNHIRNLIKNYVTDILKHTKDDRDPRVDLYVGDAGNSLTFISNRMNCLFNLYFIKISGIAYMFLRLCQTNELVRETSAIENATFYINRAKNITRPYTRPRDERCAFLAGNAGIYAMSAAISQFTSQSETLKQDLEEFEKGFDACKPIQFNKSGSDEVLVGRAGFLSGVYWLNRLIQPKPFENKAIIEICESIVSSGRQYAKSKRSPFPLMYAYHSTEYLGAAHGLCAILHMFLESPWFSGKPNDVTIPNDVFVDIKTTIDAFVGKF